MNPALVLLLATAAPANAGALPNLDFGTGRLTHWEGRGFYIAPVGDSGPTLACGVCSGDGSRPGRTGLLYRTITLPANAGVIRFQAAAVRARGLAPGAALDVVLQASGRETIPKLVRDGAGYRPVSQLLPPQGRRPREYLWNVAAHAGRRVRIAIVDDDDRPGCHVVCGGFRVVPSTAEDPATREFVAHMARLQRTHRLAPLARYDSRHFVALSNAPAGFTEYRLSNCEAIHSLFFEHFRRRGFAVREPAGKLMVAIFASQAGFEAYLGRPMSSAVTGVYHTPSNRLLVYDYGNNRAFKAVAKRSEDLAKSTPASGMERHRLLVELSRRVRDRRDDTNISTIMHEVAHQLSFNGGMLNRQGDAPAWLAEGLACYCESTVNGAWQGLGEPNPNRVAVLARVRQGGGRFLPLRSLVSDDGWLRKATSTQQVVLGYSQSWALFSFLMREHPDRLRRYLALIYPRRTAEHRLTDFAQAFGADLARLDRRYQAYLREVVRQQARVKP
jgi:hypothetical protein